MVAVAGIGTVARKEKKAVAASFPPHSVEKGRIKGYRKTSLTITV
jgi:hypothetical protein